MKLAVITTSGKNSTLTAKDEVFALKPNKPLLAQALRVYSNNQRQGTSAAKTRSAVARTSKKWFRQKGTGNARHGARNAPQFVGGGVAHGPKANQNWSLNLPTQMKRKALALALSAQAAKIKVSDEVTKLSGKTKEAAALIKTIAPDSRRTLIIVTEAEPMMLRGLRNLDRVIVTSVVRANVYEVVNATDIIMTKAAVQALEERLS